MKTAEYIKNILKVPCTNNERLNELKKEFTLIIDLIVENALLDEDVRLMYTKNPLMYVEKSKINDAVIYEFSQWLKDYGYYTFYDGLSFAYIIQYDKYMFGNPYKEEIK